jgi:hypothetical protein
MTKIAELKRLAALAALARDARLAKVAEAGAARNLSLQQLAALTPPPVNETDLSQLVLADAALRYQLWADAKRSEINRILVRQTVAWIEARDEARTAFGRADVLARLSEERR